MFYIVHNVIKKYELNNHFIHIFCPGYEIHAVDDPGSIRMDRLTDDRSGCSRQGAARQAANNRGAVRQVRFTISPPPEQLRQGGFLFLAACAAVPFRRYGCRARKPYASSLAAGERRPRKCRVNAAMIPGMISAMTPAMMAHAVMPGARRIGQDRRRGITSLLRPVRRRCFRRHRPVRRCSCRRCGSTWQCVSPRRSVCRSGS